MDGKKKVDAVSWKGTESTFFYKPMGLLRYVQG